MARAVLTLCKSPANTPPSGTLHTIPTTPFAGSINPTTTSERRGAFVAGRVGPAPHPRRKSASIITIGGTPISRVSWMTPPATDQIVPPQSQPEIIHEDSPQMPQVPHPIDIEIDEMDDTHRAMVRLFASDGSICDSERAILDRFTGHYSNVAGYRRREVAADAFKRNGASDLTGRRFADAGYGLVDLDAERKARPGANVVQFQTRKTAG